MAAILLTALFAILLCLRFHEAWQHGRFANEEGTIFFQKAWDSSWWDALFYSYGGYLNLVANAATLLAERCISLLYAPYFTMLIALAFQLIPPVLVLTARDEWLRPFWVRLTAAALLLLVPESGEVSLHSVHAQYHLALGAGIILALRTETGGAEWFRRLILALGPLSGPGGVVLAPLFGLRLLVDRSRARLIEAAVIIIASFIQVKFFFRPFAQRVFDLSPQGYLLSLFTRYVVRPFVDYGGYAGKFGLRLRHAAMNHQPELLWDAVSILLLVGLLAATAWRVRTTPAARPAGWLVLAGMTHAMASLYGALDGAATLVSFGAGERYVFVAQSLFLLAILAFTATAGRRGRWIGGVVMALLLACGARHFTRGPASIFSGPRWDTEVAAWEQDHHHVLQIWRPGWTMTLR